MVRKRSAALSQGFELGDNVFGNLAERLFGRPAMFLRAPFAQQCTGLIAVGLRKGLVDHIVPGLHIFGKGLGSDASRFEVALDLLLKRRCRLSRRDFEVHERAAALSEAEFHDYPFRQKTCPHTCAMRREGDRIIAVRILAHGAIRNAE